MPGIAGKPEGLPAIGRRLRRDASNILRLALESCAPERILSSALRRKGYRLEGPDFAADLGRRPPLILAYGKASARMARGLARILGPGAVDGFMVLPASHPRPRIAGLRSLAASHPIPDRRSFLAGRRVLERLERAGPEDPIIHLVSGGGSALLASPLPGLIDEGEKAVLHRLLVESGLGIREINLVRKHFSAVKGGRLLLRAPGASHLSLIFSDVPGGFPEAVAGGPTLPDSAGWPECLQILQESGILGELSASLRSRLRLSNLPPAPGPRDPPFRRHPWAVLASGEDLVRAAASAARCLGYRVETLKDPVEEGPDQALDRVFRARDRMRQEAGGPLCLVAGGEVRVRMEGRRGRGGRAQQLAASAAFRLRERPGSLLLAAGSDGVDGNSAAAGAMADASTVARARRKGLDPGALLAKGDTFRLFRALGDAVVTGPTGNNLRDLYLLLEIPPGVNARGASRDR